VDPALFRYGPSADSNKRRNRVRPTLSRNLKREEENSKHEVYPIRSLRSTAEGQVRYMRLLESTFQGRGIPFG